MKYIVWRTRTFNVVSWMETADGVNYKNKSYDYAQGDGYFVKYKNKCSDEYSPNWFDANKYKTIGPAISRLGLSLDNSIKTMDDFYTFNKLDKSHLRDETISKILDEDNNLKEVFFERGHIDKIDDNGNFIGNAGDEIMEYVKSHIKKQFQASKSIQKKFEKLGVGNYIDNSISDEDFWNKILK